MFYETLRGYLTPYFVETGTHTGATVDVALRVGFSHILSVEIEEKFYNMCEEKYKDNSKVSLWLGDSAVMLEEMIMPINDKITFLLDGHTHPGAKVGKKNVPILEELDAIAKHPIKNHTIVVDDVDQCETMSASEFGHQEWLDMTLQSIIDKILSINSGYNIQMIREDIRRRQTILIASIR